MSLKVQNHLRKKGRNLASNNSDINWSFDHFYWRPLHLKRVMMRFHNLYKQCWYNHPLSQCFRPFLCDLLYEEHNKQMTFSSENYIHTFTHNTCEKNSQDFTDFSEPSLINKPSSLYSRLHISPSQNFFWYVLLQYILG